MSHPDAPLPDPFAAPSREGASPAQRAGAPQREMTLFSEAPVPYLLLNSAGRIRQINAAGSTLLGQAPQQLLGVHLATLLSPGSRAAFAALLREVLSTGLKQRGAGQLLVPGGAEVLLDLSAQPLGRGFEHVRLVITELGDLSFLRPDDGAAQRQRETHAEHIRALNQEVQGVITVLVRQLHPPVARALNFLALARRALGSPTDAVSPALLKAERSVQQVVALLASIDRYLQVRRMQIRLRPVDLNRVLREVLKAAQPSMLDRQIEFTADPLPTVQGDAQALHVILEEYVANALKYSVKEPVARIHVGVQDQGAEYHISVQDNGAGFRMSHADTLFQLFGRLHPSSAFEGTGVGLVTVRRVCERFGGRVWARGEVGGGATFSFAWPKHPTVQDGL